LPEPKDVCIVPTFQRPEFLWLCLEHLEKCEGIGDLRVVVAVDNHRGRPYDPQVVKLAQAFSERLPISAMVRQPHGYLGNSYNVMTAFQEAIEAGARYVFLVEDDVMVLPDFFRWHYAVHAIEPGLFASVASLNKHLAEAPRTGDPAAYYTAKDYASIGVCLPAPAVRLLHEHTKPAYFGALVKYMQRRFPGNPWGDTWAEQDGLMLRVMAEHGLRTAWPSAARAFHTGFWGYHRMANNRMAGRLPDKVRQLREILSDGRKLNSLTPDCPDVDGVTAPVAEWRDLVRVAELA